MSFPCAPSHLFLQNIIQYLQISLNIPPPSLIIINIRCKLSESFNDNARNERTGVGTTTTKKVLILLLVELVLNPDNTHHGTHLLSALACHQLALAHRSHR